MDVNKICPHCMHQTENSSRCTYCGKNPKNTTEITHQLRPLSILQGKYLVGEVLGEGGFGITYIGLDINLQIPVAIKEFYPNGFVTRETAATTFISPYSNVNTEVLEKWRENFLGEARSLALCAHLPGVVGVKDYFQENNTVYIVQEYLEGQTLKNYVASRGGKIPANELISALKPIIIALNEVHKQEIIHRDISPDNIMLLKDGTMKVVDFGAARSFGEQNDKSKSVLLKPGYAPEEQYRTRGKQGPWTDVYALCATMYKCITSVTPLEAMERLRKDEMKWPTEMGIPISKNLEETLKKGMSIIADNRFQSMQELYDALYSLGVQEKEESSPKFIGLVASNVKSMVDDVVGGVNGVLKKPEGGQNGKASREGQNKKGIQLRKIYNVGNNKGTGSSEGTGNAETADNAGSVSYAEVVSNIGNAGNGGNGETTETSSKEKAQKPAKNIQVNKSVIMIGAAAVVCICLIVGIIGLIGKNKDKKNTGDGQVKNEVSEEMQQTETASEEINAPVSVSEAVINRLEELKATAQQLEGVNGWEGVFGELNGILIANGGSEEVKNLSKEIYNEFYSNSVEYIDMIKNIEEFNADMYRECILRYEELEKWNSSLGCGYDAELVSSKESCKKEYKNKFVDRFDTKCVETMNQNGVISRTVAWEAVQGVENTDLYNSGDAGNTDSRYDALRLRYIAGKVLKIHKDIEGMNWDDAINMIRNAMVECDYDPMLIYLLDINGYEAAQTWMRDVEYIIYSYASVEDYRYMADNDRINWVYLYNAFPDKFKECREAVIQYMQENYY